jgi:uncharacterized membrane-anchored protein YitT (DUF2179 family)
MTGALLYVLSYKLFIIPLQLYIGGFPGISQIVNELTAKLFHDRLNFDFTGIFLWIMNIPMFLLGVKIINRRFFAKSIINVLFLSVLLSALPAADRPMINDTLTSCIIGGALSGAGIGIMLQNGGCGGGLDILGLYASKKYPALSVGKIAIILNVVIYTYSAIMKDFQTAVYSMIFAILASLVTDRLHYQNIKTCVVIISKIPGIERPIIEKMKRGVTIWMGFGGYHMENTYIYLTMISKYEIHYLEHTVKALDPHAFIILDENHRTIGNFEKRFDI